LTYVFCVHEEAKIKILTNRGAARIFHEGGARFFEPLKIGPEILSLKK